MTILDYTLTVFISQILFVGFRTWNILAISKENLLQSILSGAFVHLTWLVTVSIGVVSASEIMQEMNWDYVPVIIGSTVGGALGTTISLKKNILTGIFQYLYKGEFK